MFDKSKFLFAIKSTATNFVRKAFVIKQEKPQLHSHSATSKWKNIALAFLMTQSFPSFIYGQTVVKGRVTDAETFEPVVFENIVFKGTLIGVKTDFDVN
ncbi:MAG: hypothetical protein NT092_13125 [Bacteroidia bacterium]|nr:hypothetical protein [Bacteroidia bacterium]